MKGTKGKWDPLAQVFKECEILMGEGNTVDNNV